jgi:SpoVK/Ycf46/Vps4 family AAA+-type ATPase
MQCILTILITHFGNLIDVPFSVFIDEGEELFGKKSKATNEASKNMASKLLSLMTDESRVLVACATNSPW